jgi:hypothetical protein
LSKDFEKITNEWKIGGVSNFDYLLYLNYLAGRNFNTLSQYPVFPWIVKDFTSPEISMESPTVSLIILEFAQIVLRLFEISPRVLGLERRIRMTWRDTMWKQKIWINTHITSLFITLLQQTSYTI